jgi:hypothetical protein
VEVEDDFVKEEFHEYNFIDEEFNMEMFIKILSMKMLRILHNDFWIGILHQPMIVISTMKIL